MLQDKNLEFNKQWEPKIGPGIGSPGSPNPTSYPVIPANATNPALTVGIVGAGYADMMAATHRPLMPVFDLSNIYYSLEYNINIDPNVLTQCQALESEADFTYVDAKGISWQMPGDWQINIQEGWMVQGFTVAKPWLDTGIKIPKMTPGVFCPVKISYLVDLVKNNISTLGFVVNGVSYAMPSAFQKVPAQQKNTVPNVNTWAAGMYVQFQLDLASKGGSITNKYTSVAIDWE